MAFFKFFALGDGCLNWVFSRAMAAAACWAFFILGPLAIYSSLSPIFRHTVKVFLCAGPDSSVSLYWCPTLLYLASSFTRHMGVFSLVEEEGELDTGDSSWLSGMEG